MKTQGRETGTQELGTGRAGRRIRSLSARCAECGGVTIFSARQVATAHQIWKLASGREGVAAPLEFLGGDATTNQCDCGMEGEVVFTGEAGSLARWRRSRLAPQVVG